MQRPTLPFTLAALLISAACGGDSGDDAAAPDAGTAADRLQIVTPTITLAPAEETTKCYFFTMPTATDVAVRRWASRMTPGSHHMILFQARTMAYPEGTITDDCSIGGLDSVWTYAAQTPEAESVLPAGVGMAIAAGQPAVIQMHYLNASDTALDAHVEITADLYPAGTAYQKAQPFVTFNSQINIPPMTSGSAQGTCAVPPGAKFFAMSTHSHKHTTRTAVTDGAALVFESDDWADPAPVTWTTEPFFTFASGGLTYRCDYTNLTAATVRTGDSAETDEMCMAVGYYFPAEQPTLCLNSFVVP